MNRIALSACLAAILPSCQNLGWSYDSINLHTAEHVEREVSFELDVGDGETLGLVTPYGDVTVRAATGTPRLVATIKAYAEDEATAQKLLDRLQVAHQRRGGRWEFALADFVEEPGTMAAVSFVAAIERGTAIDATSGCGTIRTAGSGETRARSGYGSIQVDDVTGPVDAQSSSGKISVRRASGGAIALDTGYGEVRLWSVKAPLVVAESSSGSIFFHDVEARKITAHTGYGDVELRDVRGSVEVRTSSGSLTALDTHGDVHTLETGYGGIRVESGSGALAASSESGAIRVVSFDGQVKAHSDHGNVGVDGVLKGIDASSDSGAVRVTARSGSACEATWRVHSGYGRVDVELPAKFEAEIDARTANGHVDIGREISVTEGAVGNSQLRGRIGRGGGRLQLTASSGTIQVR